MAVTQKTGALANAGAQASSISQSLANMAANLHYTGSTQPQKSKGQEYTPSYQPAYQPQQQGSFSSGGSAAAAQHIIQQARNQQVTRQNVFNDVAKQAVLSALAVATGQQPGRQYTPPPVLQYRQGSDASGHQLTPQQESQLFDQQIQITKAQTSPQAWLDPSYPARVQDAMQPQIDTMRQGFANPVANPRIDLERQAMTAFPQTPVGQVRTRTDQQLQAMLGLAQQPPATAAGTPDQPTATVAPAGEMTRGVTPVPDRRTNGYGPSDALYGVANPSGATLVSQAMQDALRDFGAPMPTIQHTTSDVVADDDDGGGFWGTFGDVVDIGLHAGGSVNPINLIENVAQGGASAVNFLGDTAASDLLDSLAHSGAGTYEAFVSSPPGRLLTKGLEGLDWPRQQNVGLAGEQAYGAATGDWKKDTGGRITNLLPGGEYIDASPDTLLWLAMFQADGNLQTVVTDAYENGYSSPSYVKVAQSQGIDPATIGPQFTGGRAVWEAVMGYTTDDLPPVVKYGVRMLADLVMDPLTYAPILGEAGKAIGATGHALRIADDASLGARAAGGVLEGIGKTGELAARAPDLPVEGLIKGGKGIGSKVGEVTGLLSPSTEAQRVIARAETATADELIQAARESVPASDGRRLFDAEAQGVEPSSGPELINANSVAEDAAPPSGSNAPTAPETNPIGRTETSNARTAPGANTAPNRTGSASAIETDSNAAPAFEDLPDAPGSTPERPSKRYDYGGQTLVIRSETAKDGSLFFSAFRPGATKPNQMLTADTYAELIDTLPSKFGPPLGPTTTAPRPRPTAARAASTSFTARPAPQLIGVKETGGGWQAFFSDGSSRGQSGALPPHYADAPRVNTTTDVTRLQSAAGGKPPTPRAQRAAEAEASASTAANTAPNSPRNPGEAQVVNAAEHAKTVDPTRKPMKPGDRRKFPTVAKAEDRYRRLVKEDREGLPKEVSSILRKQEPGEHEFSPIYGGDRPIDRIVTEAIDSKDPAKLAQAEQFVKRLDAKVEQELRPDAFYQTWKNGGAPVYLQDDPRFTDAFFEQMRALDPTANPKRLRTLANGLAKGVLDDIAMVQFQLDQVVPLIRELYPDASLDGIFGKVGRAESRDFKDESAEWLIREYLLTNDAGRADTILRNFLINPDEVPIIADGVHKPFAHSVPAGYETESLARLMQMREQATAMKRAEQLRDGSLSEVSMAPFREPDVAAQFAGGLRGSSKSFAESLRSARASTRHRVTTDAMVEAAIGEIRDPQLRFLLLNGDGTLTVEMAQVGDRILPASWRPPGYVGDKTAWNVREALDALTVYRETHPAFDLNRARDEVAELGAGLTPRRTPSELASMRQAARAQGLDPQAIRNGASSMERVTATRLVRALDKYLSYWRQLRLFNIVTGLPNRIGDQLGNMTTLALRGDPIDVLRYLPASAKSTRTLRASGRDAHRALEAMVLDSPIMRETGQTYPTDLIPGKVLNDIERSGLPVYNDLLKGTPAGVRATANLATVPLLKDVTVAGEMAGRKIAFESVYAETLAQQSLPAFKEWLRSAHPTQADGMLADIERRASETGGRGYSGYFSPGDVLAATGDHQAQRIWQRELTMAAQKGKAEANRLFFSNVNTNLDEIARRTFTFHFWMTRATALYGRTVLRNPALLNGVYRMWQRAEAISREQGLPDWLATMFKFYQSPTGMYAAFSPIGTLFPTFFLDAYSQEGNKFQALQNLLNPLLGGALGAVGLTQNIPDVTGTRNIERFIVDMGNFLKGEGIPLESVPFFGQYVNQDSLQLTIPTEEFTKLVLQKANDLLGEPLGTFKPFDRQANEEDQLYSMGEQIAVRLWGPDIQNWTPAQIQELTDAVHQAQYGDGEETWLSETIRATYGREGGARAGFSLLIPGGVVTRQQFRDDQIKAAGEYWDAFYAGQPTTKEGESAAIGRQLATSANPAWIAMNDAYYQIGTKQQQTMYSAVNSMLYSPGDLNPKQSIIIDNGDGSYTIYSMDQLAGMSDKDRRTVVDAWVANNPTITEAVKTVKDGRDHFKADHPDYARYSEYQSGVFKYDGGPSQFRKHMQDNPTFKAAEEDERQRLKKEGKSGAVLEAELDHWATTQQAFFAATGQQYKRDDVIQGTPGPSSVAAMFSLRDDQGPASGDGASAAPRDPTIDDYWSPEKGVPRLEQNQAQYAYDNAQMEARFGPYWNQATAEWENNADSAKERDNLGIGDKTYVLPSVSETMRRYEAWEDDHPGGSPEEFFEEMLQTVGFGRKSGKITPTLPGGTTISTPPGVAAYPVTAAGQLQATLQRLGLGR